MTQLKYVAYALALGVAGGFFFIDTLLEDCLGGNPARNVFMPCFVLDVVFLLSMLAATIWFFASLFRRKPSSMTFNFLYLACAVLSFYAQSDLQRLGDRLFIWLEQPIFEKKIQTAGGTPAAVILHWIENGHSSKLIVYSGTSSFADGSTPLKALGIFERLDATGYSAYITHLQGHYYRLLLTE